MNHQLNAIAAGIESFNSTDPAQVEQYSKLLDAEYEKYNKLQAIGAGIEDSGTVCIADIRAMEELCPGLMDASGNGDQDFTLRPSENGVVAALEAFNWASFGKWAFIIWVTAFVINIIRAIGAVRDHNAKVHAFNDAQAKRRKAFEEAQRSWQDANRSYSGGSNKGGEYYNKSSYDRSRTGSESSSSSSGSSGGESYYEKSRRANEEARREKANRDGYNAGGSNEQERAKAGAEDARNRTNGSTNSKARANVELMDEFAKVTRFFLKEGKTGFSSSRVYTTGGWTIEHVIKQKIEYWMLCGPDGHFQYKETFFYNPDKQAVTSILNLIKAKGEEVKLLMPDVQSKFDSYIAIDDDIKGILFQGKQLFSSGSALTDERVTPFINKIATVGRELSAKISALPNGIADEKNAEKYGSEMQTALNLIWPVDHSVQNQYKDKRKDVHSVTVDVGSVTAIYAIIEKDAAALRTVEASLKKAHDAAEGRKKESNSPIVALVATIQSNDSLSPAIKQQAIQNLTALNRQYSLYGNAVVKSYQQFQKGLSHLAHFFKRIEDATTVVTTHLEYETKMEARFKKLYEHYAKA